MVNAQEAKTQAQRAEEVAQEESGRGLKGCVVKAQEAKPKPSTVSTGMHRSKCSGCFLNGRTYLLSSEMMIGEEQHQRKDLFG